MNVWIQKGIYLGFVVALSLYGSVGATNVLSVGVVLWVIALLAGIVVTLPIAVVNELCRKRGGRYQSITVVLTGGMLLAAVGFVGVTIHKSMPRMRLAKMIGVPPSCVDVLKVNGFSFLEQRWLFYIKYACPSDYGMSISSENMSPKEQEILGLIKLCKEELGVDIVSNQYTIRYLRRGNGSLIASNGKEAVLLCR